MDAKPGNTGSRKIIKVRGIVISGMREAGRITEQPWVREQFINKLGVVPHPGTFNIRVLAEDTAKLNTIKQSKGVEITPSDPHHCTGLGFPALLGGKVRGAVIIPQIPNYPPAQLEIISSENIRRSLSLQDGNEIEVEVYL
jgi:CTP-dependent riboflavin kinase